MIQAGIVSAVFGISLSMQPGQAIPAGGSITLFSTHVAVVAHTIITATDSVMTTNVRKTWRFRNPSVPWKI
ncbi:hypothetical protein EV401DRAFT_1906538 [Pisolithus croceorrhizus]|nr:hypothetical protein EV401DRAFT_1906538 [Pisolithus croceorrhizus]